MARNTGLTLDTTRLMAYFVKNATKALSEANDRCFTRAQKYAPVRKIFRGTTYRRTAGGYRVPKMRSIRFAEGGGEISGRRLKTKTTDVVERQGHANSLLPVMRFRQAGGGTYAVTGDIRALGRKPELTVIARSRTGEERLVKPGTPEHKAVTGKIELTVAGRYEARSGRARFVGADKRARLGGRLLESLRKVEPTYKAGRLWAYVVSPVKDPETGYPYGTAQEFGTIRHRAQPYLRPALQESRGDLSSLVSRYVSVGRLEDV